MRASGSLRTYDSIGRFGGEEFLIVAPGCGVVAAQELADRLRRCVCEMEIVCGGRTLNVTVSLGVASSTAQTATTLLRQADDALYRAKSNGRNRLEVDAALLPR